MQEEKQGEAERLTGIQQRVHVWISLVMEKLVARDSNEKAASSSQVRISDIFLSSSAGTLVAMTAKNSVGVRLSRYNMAISPKHVDHLAKVYSNVRRELGRQPNDDMLEVDVSTMIWGKCVSATMKAAVHLAQSYQENLRTTSRQDHIYIYIYIYTFFKLIFYGTSTGIKIIIYTEYLLTKLSNCQQQRCTSSQIRCFASEAELLSTQSVMSWKDNIIGSRSLHSIVNWTVLLEDESCSRGKLLPRTQQLLQETRRTMEENKTMPEKFEDRIVFMSMFNDIDLRQSGNKEICCCIRRNFSSGHGSFFGPGSREKWQGRPAQRERTSSIQRNKCFLRRSCVKQRRWKNIDTLQCGSRDSIAVISHHKIRQSAQYLRSSSGLV